MDYAQHLGGLNIKRVVDTLGTAHVAGDYALHANFGTTATIAVASGSNDSGGGFTVTCGGSGHGANPTVVLTFADGAFPAAPVGLVACRSGGSQRDIPIEVTTVTTTAATFTLIGTAAGVETYEVRWHI